MSIETNITGLARRLVSESLLEQASAVQAFGQAKQLKLPFVRHLVQNNIVASSAIASVAAREFGLPYLDLDALDQRTLPIHLVEAKLIRKHQVLPLLKRGRRLYLGIADPSNVNAISEIKFHTGHSIETIIVEDDKLQQAIERALENQEGRFKDLGGLEDMAFDSIELEQGDEADETEDGRGEEAIDDTPVVRFVNRLLVDAIKSGTSDIHVEPYERSYRIRFRQDGILHEVARPPLNFAKRIAARFKIMARMDISEKRLPQDGRIKMKLSTQRAIDFRVNTLPTLWGEKVVLRILDPASARMGIDALGFELEQKQHFMNALQQHQGMILVTGPTGSGKTVSLYAGLNILNTAARNISTAEDPVEINLEGINQVAINNKVGLDFATALRAFLRQDPDVVMLGEIRDLETAEIAIKAAQTGHLVLSTLHTNSAPETLSRLRNMGIAAFNIASSVSLIVAQRLARRLCRHCRKPIELPTKVLLQEGFSEAQISDIQLFNAVGCDKCREGYRGRLGIYEVMPVTDRIAQLIMENHSALQIAEQARKEGIKDLRASALAKVAQGLTSLAEANRLT